MFFSSIFNPSCLVNLRILSSSGLISNSNQFKFKKVLVKQSYLLLLWIKYINYENQKQSIICLPRKKSSHFTKNKSPMAQKTYSQEQFTFKMYKYTFNRVFIAANPCLSNKDLLSIILYSRMSSYFWGTNLLFLSSVNLVLTTKALDFLKL